MDELRYDRDILEGELTRLVQQFEDKYNVRVTLDSEYLHCGDRVPKTYQVKVTVEV